MSEEIVKKPPSRLKCPKCESYNIKINILKRTKYCLDCKYNEFQDNKNGELAENQ